MSPELLARVPLYFGLACLGHMVGSAIQHYAVGLPGFVITLSQWSPSHW